jgi:hypothetical protein
MSQLFFESGGCFNCEALRREISALRRELEQERKRCNQAIIEARKLESALSIRPHFEPVTHDPRQRRR